MDSFEFDGEKYKKPSAHQQEWGEKLIAALSKTHLIEGHDIEIGVSIGVSFFPEFADNMEQLLKQADMMMYRAKDAGRNTCRVYSADDMD